MRRFRSVYAIALSVCLLVGSSQTVLAGPATHATVRLNNATIPWVFPPPDGLSSFCSEVPSGVHINPDNLGSDRLKQASLVARPDGTKHVVISDLIKGTAHDNYGTAYTFVYVNNATYDFDGSIVTVAMKDSFHLKGGTVNYTVGFNWRWAYPAASLDVIPGVEDIVVNPSFFATSDGVHEDPNIVPGSWEKVNTRGDPINCDVL